MALLELRGVSKAFGGLQVVDRLNLEVAEGEIVSVIGPNGAGKTTLFNLITGIYRPDSGEIQLDGRNIVGMAPHKITVNAIAPGGVTSPMAIEKDGIDAVRERMKKIPLQRWAEPEEIAQGMLYLVTAGFVTGQTLSLNGGDTIVGI